MKNTFTLFFLFCCYNLFAQTDFYGVASGAGGSIYHYNAATNALRTVYKHQVNEAIPVGTLSAGPDGKLYGMTNRGGFEKTGAIYSYDPATNSYALQYAFTSEQGSQPTGSIAWGADGKMYGLTTYGGTYNNGVLFSFDPGTKSFQKLYEFNGANGANPMGSLYLHTDGKLYGVTNLGGSEDMGVVFSFAPATKTYQKRYDFRGTDGGAPYGGLAKGQDGKLYGATSRGGPEEWFAGGLYRFDPANGSVAHLYRFNMELAPGGPVPGELKLMADGKLYGVLETGGANFGGAVFSFNPATKAFATVHSFSDAQGAKPAGGLINDASGNLWGMTAEGAGAGLGGIFSFNPATKVFTVRYSFQYNNGAYPSGALCLGKDGRLFGALPYGGSKEYGVLFSFQPTTAAYTKIKEFDEAPDGASPVAPMMQHTDGAYYGSTIDGGIFGGGVIYRFRPATATYEVVYRFGANDGRYMSGAFVAGKDGQLYGLMNQGGNGVGVICAFDPANRTYRQVHVFEEATGAYPNGSLLAAPDGKYYGVTGMGGAFGYGTIFSFAPATGTYTKLHDFDRTNGEMPGFGLTLGADGRLYGLTQWGGSENKGVAFVFNPVSRVFSNLFSFNSTSGENPRGGFTLGTDKRLYGTTPAGGANGFGTLFSLAPAEGQVNYLHQFSGLDGNQPAGCLTLAADGRFLGTAYQGGAGNQGVLFAYNPATSQFQKLKDFQGSGSSSPMGNGMTANCAQPQTWYRDNDGDGAGDGNAVITACNAPQGYVAEANDCNDQSASVNPKAVEVCGNGIDDNCDGNIDEGCITKPSLMVGNLTVRESQRVALVQVRLSKALSKEVSVMYHTRNGSARAGQDYQMRTGRLRIPAGQTTATIRINIVQDRVREGNEFFDLVLSRAKEAALLQGVARVTIQDASAAGVASIAEGANSGDMTLVASGLQATAFPNPSASQFTIVAAGNAKERIDLVVVDGSGRLVETRRGLAVGQQVLLGGNYTSGFYLVRLVQGTQVAELKLIKR